MSKRHLITTVSAVLSSLCFAAAPADWYVDVSSTASTPDGKSWETAFKDIQSAIDAAKQVSWWDDQSSRDRVHIKPGHYLLETTLTCNKCLTFIGVTDKALKDGSVPEVEQVVIDGQNKVCCLSCTSAVTLDFLGLSFTNGRYDVPVTGANNSCGGAISIQSGQGKTATTISNCVFRSCVSGPFGEAGVSTQINGGAVGVHPAQKGYLYDSLFENCGITNGCKNATPTYTGNAFYGGAIYGVTGACSGNVFRRCFIDDPMNVWQVNRWGAALYSANEMDNCLFESNYIHGVVNSKARYTAAYNYGNTYSNLVFIGNSAPCDPCFAAGVCQLVTDCSFIGNRATWLGCAGVSVSFPTGVATNRLRNCLFLNNDVIKGTETNYEYPSVCIHAHLGGESGKQPRMFVENCTFIGNTSSDSQAGVFSGFAGSYGAYVQVTNCWVEGNHSATNVTAPNGNAVLNLTSVSNFDIIDTVFKKNSHGISTEAKCGMILRADGGSANGLTTNSTVRNCAFIDNITKSPLYVQTTVTDESMPGLTIENCTIVGNRMPQYDYQYAVREPPANARMFMYNCVVYNNSKNGSNYYNLYTKWKGHVFNTYVGPQPSYRSDFAGDGNIVDVDDPRLVDVEAGDCRPARKSCLVDAGQQRPWMSAGARDISNMKPVYDATGKLPGCQILRLPKAVRRICGESPDIGAYEYRPKMGLAVIVR